MRRVWLLASLLAAAAGNLCANGALTLTCSLNVIGIPGPFSGLGSVGANGCFSTSFSNVTGLDSLNWGAPAESSGPSGLGSALSGNSFSVTTTTPVQTGTVTQDNEQVTILLAPGYSSPPTTVTRADDFYWQWTGAAWVSGSDLSTPLTSFAGHFNSASSASLAAASPTNDDQLLESSSGAPLKLEFLGPPAFGVWFQIASLSGTNSLFVAKVQAFDSSGNPIGSYQLTESGSYGSGGVCGSLERNHPVACNDAPYVGFYDPEGRISSIYVSVFDPSNLTTPIGFAIDSLLDDDPVPEPAMVLMIGGGLAAIALYGRKRRARSE